MAKAILLLSGGLDSTLAGKLLLDQGVEVEAVSFVSPFCCCTPKGLGCSAAKKAADQLGIRVDTFSCGEEYLDAMKRPRFGRGSQMNACLDCRVFMFSRARDEMEKRGADFVATGEVLGERPMSQRRVAMKRIERESGLEGKVVRPLSAKLFEPSVPEQLGLVDRSRFAAVQGRSRRPQFALAEQLGITDYLCPAGGCLLNDPEFAARFRDLLHHEPDFGIADARLLRWGRHFRLPGGAKVVVGRDQSENTVIENAMRIGDTVMVPHKITGPSVLCRGVNAADVGWAAGIPAAYTKGGVELDAVARTMREGGISESMARNVAPLPREMIAAWRVEAAKVTPTLS